MSACIVGSSDTASTIIMTDIAIATSPKSAGDKSRPSITKVAKSMLRVPSRETIMRVAPAAVRPLTPSVEAPLNANFPLSQNTQIDVRLNTSNRVNRQTSWRDLRVGQVQFLSLRLRQQRQALIA